MALNGLQKIGVHCLENAKYKKVYGLLYNLPSMSSIMGFVPFATPQTFSRMVVLPALARPMTRMRKCGHLYRSLRILISSTSALTKN